MNAATHTALAHLGAALQRTHADWRPPPDGNALFARMMHAAAEDLGIALPPGEVRSGCDWQAVAVVLADAIREAAQSCDRTAAFHLYAAWSVACGENP